MSVDGILHAASQQNHNSLKYNRTHVYIQTKNNYENIWSDNLIKVYNIHEVVI